MNDNNENVLDKVAMIFDRYVVFPSPEARDAAVLWAAHTHVIDVLPVTPRLAVMSSEPGSGKSTVLHVLKYLVRNGEYAQRITGPAISRLIEQEQPTILFDEIDAVFGASGAGKSNEALRSIINAGYTRGNNSLRAVGTDKILRETTFVAVAMGGLGNLPATLADRSVTIRMVARSKDSPDVLDFDPTLDGDVVKGYGRSLARWARTAKAQIRLSDPEINGGINRQRQIWLPLFQVADVVGGDWPVRAARAFRELTKEDKEPLSLPLQLIHDTHAVWPGEAEFVPSVELLEALKTHDDMWLPATPQTVARILARYGVSPRTVRRDDDPSVKAYTRADMEPVWEMYL